MYFLNGDRIYIKPVTGRTSMDEQLMDCLGQLARKNKAKKIYKLNFFADTPSSEIYQQIKYKLEKLATVIFNSPVIVSLISQSPLTCKILVEAFYYDSSVWKSFFFKDEYGAAILFNRGNTEILIGNLQDSSHGFCKINAEKIFTSFSTLLEKYQFPVSSIVRQWNYI